MVIVDTSVWVEFFRNSSLPVRTLLGDVELIMHPYILAELCCGNLPRRKSLIPLLRTLPFSQPVDPTTVIDFIETAKLYGTGLGYVDINIFLSAQRDGYKLMTKDRRLRELAHRYDILA